MVRTEPTRSIPPQPPTVFYINPQVVECLFCELCQCDLKKEPCQSVDETALAHVRKPSHLEHVVCCLPSYEDFDEFNNAWLAGHKPLEDILPWFDETSPSYFLKHLLSVTEPIKIRAQLTYRGIYYHMRDAMKSQFPLYLSNREESSWMPYYSKGIEHIKDKRSRQRSELDNVYMKCLVDQVALTGRESILIREKSHSTSEAPTNSFSGQMLERATLSTEGLLDAPRNDTSTNNSMNNQQITLPSAECPPPRRGRGRPPGSRNKNPRKSQKTTHLQNQTTQCQYG